MNFALAADSAEKVVSHCKSLLCFEVKNIDRVFLRPGNNCLTVTGHGETHGVLLEVVLEQELTLAAEVEKRVFAYCSLG